MRCLLLILAIVFTSVQYTSAQQNPALKKELEYVDRMQTQGYSDLALDYLETQLTKRFPKARVLQLELIKAKMGMAQDELNVEKRLKAINELRKEIEAYLRIPKAPARNDAQYQLARIGALEGRTQLRYAQSLGPDEFTKKQAALKQARSLLGTATTELEKHIKTLSGNDQQDAQLDLSQLYLDQARTWSMSKDIADLRKRSDVLVKAQKILDELVIKIPKEDPRHWVTKAWQARTYQKNSEVREAERIFGEITSQRTNSVTLPGQRQAYYFIILGEQESYEEDNKKIDHADLEKKATRWLELFGKRRSPELFGMLYVHAKQNFEIGRISKSRRVDAWKEARTTITRIEAVDNEYSTRATNLKLAMLAAQGAFDVPPSRLGTFDDLYVRALYEHDRFNTGGKDGKEFDTKEKQKKQQEFVINVLERALTRSKDKTASRVNVGKATYLLAGYKMTVGEAQDAVKVGEQFVRDNPRVGSAPDVALVVAQALLKLIADEKDAKKREAHEKHLVEFSKLMMQQFPREEAGKLGRYYVVQDLLKKDKLEEALAIPGAGNDVFFSVAMKYFEKQEYLKAIEQFERISPDFSRYNIAQFYRADSAIKIASNNEVLSAQGKPLVKLDNGKTEPRVYALNVLRAVTKPYAGAEAAVRNFYVQCKMRLAAMLYTEKKFDEMDKVSQGLLEELNTLTVADDKAESDAQVAKIRKTLNEYLVYVLYSKARDQYNNAQYQQTIDLLKPVLDELMGDGPGTGKKATLKGNRPLLSAILGYGMRSLIQLGRVPEGMKVLENWETLIKEAGGQFDLKKILKQSIGAMRRQINLLSQEKDKTKLNKTINSFSSFLDNVSTKEESNDLSFTRLLVLSYSSINKHQGAVKLLKDQVPDSVKSTVNKAFERWKKETGATTYKAPELTFLDNIINKLIQKHEQDKKFDLLDPKTLRGLGEILTNLIRLDKQTMIAKKMLDDGVADALAASIESDISIWKVLQTYKAREMRLYAETMPDAIKKKEMLIDALSVINQIIESWGKTDLLAIKERLRIFKSMTYYGNVINLANPLANQLLRVVERPGIKDHYFDVMYELFTCYTLYSEEKGNTTKGQKALEAAALKYVLLEQNFSDMGGDVMKGRFEDFIKEHPELQKKIEEIKKAQTAKTAN